MRYTILFILFLFIICSLGATTYYVDFAAGNDANDGLSTSNPWRTIPGTYDTAGSALKSAAWGSYTTGNRILDNIRIKIKSGTTHGSANGGFIWLTGSSASVWTYGCTNIIIEADPTWGTGTTATLDGTGMTIGIGLILNQIDGVTFDGLLVINSDTSGFQCKEKATGDQLTNFTIINCTVTNNGKSYLTDVAGAGDGQINIRHAMGVLLSNVVAHGNQVFVNGFLFGDNHKYVEGRVIDCTAANHQGDYVDNDAGIGFKALNARITFSNCVACLNLKGFDIGEQAGVDANYGNPVNILCKVINCTARTNTWGINFNGSADAYTGGTITHYVINNLITDNDDNGMNVYAAPHTIYIVGNIFDRNGMNAGSTPLYNASQITTTPNDNTTDSAQIKVYLLNNIFRGQASGGGNNDSAIILNKYFDRTVNNYTLTSDYNYYEQSAGNTVFCMWAAYQGSGFASYSFGVNGPGHASGNWYSQYGNDGTVPVVGTGHFHSDAHSKGTGCDDTTPPPINSSYIPTNNYSGSILSTQSWFIAEMGIDRAGAQRVNYTLGAYEYINSHVSAIVGQGISINKR